MMSRKADTGSGINTQLLLIISIVAGILGVITVFTGLAFILLSVFLCGVVQLSAAVLSYCIFFKQKLIIAEKEKDESTGKVVPDPVKEEPLSGEGEVEPSSGNNAEPEEVLPPYQLKTFLQRDYYIVLTAVSLLGLAAAIYVLFNLNLVAEPAESNIFLMGAAGIIISFVYMFGANWLNYYSDGDGSYVLTGHFFRAAQVTAFLSGVSLIIKAYGFYGFEYFLVIAVSVLLAVSLTELGFNAIQRLLVRPEDYSITIDLHILPALLSGKNPFNMLLLSLEKRSGITIRSAWTYGFLRKSIPPLFITAIILLWLMTGLVQINTDEKGVKYRFGQLQPEILLPGLYLKFPWPVETVQTLPAYGHHQFTVGYEGEPRTDYLWTSFHGGEEDIFLLGDGRELVSINMLVTYKISDIYNYLMQYEEPDEVLRAGAYEILMQEIVKSDLDELLSTDRTGLSGVISRRLQMISNDLNLGLEVVNVALPSIHPPVEIAREYQEFLGARIQKQILIIEALTDTMHNLPFGEEIRNRLIAEAKIEALTAVAGAESEKSKSAFQREAFNENPEMFEFLKWLEAFEDAVEGRDIYLIVDDGDIWLDIRGITEGGNIFNE